MATTGVGSGGALLLAGALLSLLNPMMNAATMMPEGLTPQSDLHHTNTSGICTSKDIRNTLKSFEKLRGCRVVEGFVQILLFDNVNESAFDDISFPELTEITDFLLLYRVNGLKSVGQLFPNLAVIRGQDKVFGYSFVIYEMSSLQEIGLYSLTDITSGLIRIDKNPSLCFAKSIDWEHIAHEKGEHFIRNVKAENECPLCPGDDDSAGFSCPNSTNKNTLGRHLCWNRQHCQKVCKKECGNSTCDSKGNCCDEKCLGGCKDNNKTHCHVCRDFTYAEGVCLKTCPPDYFQYLGRRCITADDCKNMKRPLKLHMKIQHEKPFKLLNKTCLLECPAKYMDNIENRTCVLCGGDCKKECPGTVIDSIEAAQQLRGCTHINGSLEIQIRGGKNIVNELEKNLEMIEEIAGYIKVVRSFPLVSLNFLKRLKVIRGKYLESSKFVFVVLDNQNLQEIWNWENRTLRIDNGRLFFHFNPKLCIDKIQTLKEKAKLSDFDDLEVAKNSNGDKTACNVKNLDVNITVRYSKSIVLRWSQFEMRDHRKLLGYLVYVIKAPYKNITMYDGRDACGGDGWRVDDVQVYDQNNPTYLLSQLEPYTQYAFYVKTYTIASETTGAQSPIYYVRTNPDMPSAPVNLAVTSQDDNILTIKWGKPLYPNGNVTYYIVTGVASEVNRTQLLAERNFCNTSAYKMETISRSETKITPKQNNTCECKDAYKPTPKIKQNETDVQNQINFEDKLYNFVYVKRNNNSRRKRSDGDYNTFPATNSTEDADHSENDYNPVLNLTDDKGYVISFNYRVIGALELNVQKLKRFTNYDITIKACREREKEDNNKYCSATSIQRVRTGQNESGDLITTVKTNVSGNNVEILWDEPIDPNGHILSYTIEYQRVDIDNSQPFKQCYPASDYLKHKKFILKALNPGNYSLKLIATSQAADHGPPSEPVYFLIEEANARSYLAVIVPIICVCVVVVLSILWWARKKHNEREDMKLIASVNPVYISYLPDEWEVQRDKIKLIKELGQGSFGMVYEGIAKDIKGKATTKCAIKTVNEHATNRERIEFLNEASVMKAFDTAHVVRLLGVVSQGQPTLVIMELMANGDLKTYLRSHRPDLESYVKNGVKQPPTLKRILQMAIEIADGMAYLAAKKFVHRDLAARNCMVAEDLTVKIGDFGMTRDIYETDYYRKGTKGLLPVRWMAPESLRDGVFTSSSDVWSYGVVLWEMATLASQPYQGLSNDQVLRYVIDGGIMERPENCPDKLYDLMMCCWRHNPSDRATFLNLCSMLVGEANHSFCQISFYHSAAGMEARNSKPSNNSLQDDPSTPLKIDSLISDEESDQEELEANGYVSNGTMP